MVKQLASLWKHIDTDKMRYIEQLSDKMLKDLYSLFITDGVLKIEVKEMPDGYDVGYYQIEDYIIELKDNSVLIFSAAIVYIEEDNVIYKKIKLIDSLYAMVIEDYCEDKHKEFKKYTDGVFWGKINGDIDV